MRFLISWFRYQWGITVHKFYVFCSMVAIAAKILWLGIVHDNSKYRWSEAQGFIRVLPKLYGMTYGTPCYMETLKEIQPNVDLHYKRNPHHPEHYGGIEKMSLLDTVEMVCDWKVAIKKHHDGNIERSFNVNRTRFGITPEREALMRSLL